ncbi:hypothetical protein CWE04_07955 [Thomasclavelia cocleata]|uniref:SynChlorMet cassette protein ScmC n=2 Tax=Thomasclavelia cocleata TaxID=69824 RepID=A0A1I0GU70_9FIRM|nr:hypothetical protein [Thomasclavelia cocleata]PJN80543.1 hypothetical protein CWE04_07955 [Thomasclavelia cocleata]SET74024.1 hypothetical protein SAMN04489758_1353 [Thomasclavelia cocleata]
MKFYKIAGCIVEYEPIYPLLKNQMEAYRIDEQKIDMKLTITKEFCEIKQQENPHLTLEQCEYIYAGSQFYNKLINLGGFLLHASAVVIDNKAYLFSADSGTGKSTHTKLWQKCFGDKALIINDDKPAIKIENGICYAYGTPFSGKTDENLNMKVPLQAICFLERGKDNSIDLIPTKDALPLILKQTIFPKKQDTINHFFDMLDVVLTKTPIYQMKCNISKEAALMAYDKMKGE